MPQSAPLATGGLASPSRGLVTRNLKALERGSRRRKKSPSRAIRRSTVSLPKMLSNTAIIEAMNARRQPSAFLGLARKTGQYAISIEAPIADDMRPQRQPDAGA